MNQPTMRSPSIPLRVSGTARFGAFELDLSTRELVKEGKPVPLQALAAKALVLMVERAGRLVPRQALVEALWPDTVVDYEQGLNNTIRHLRNALGDDPQSPLFIETVPRQGYRFIARLQLAAVAAPSGDRVAVEASAPQAVAASAVGRRRAWVTWALAGLAAAAVVLALRLTPPRFAAETPTVAVLPFSGTDQDAEIVGAGLAEELTRELTIIAGHPLRVVGYRSAVRAGREEKTPRDAGVRLDATHVVTGSIRPAGGDLHLSIALVRVADGETLWEESSKRSWPDLLTTQRQLARGIGTRVSQRLSGGLPEVEAVQPVEPAALESYLKGKYLLVKGSPGSIEAAMALLEDAVETGPRFAQARVALGEALLASGGAGGVDRSRRLAEEAMRLDPRDPGAYLLRFRIALSHEWDWRLAEQNLRRAVELAPDDPMVHLANAAYLSTLGRHAAAVESALLAARLDPLSSTTIGDLMVFRFWAEDWSGMLAESERVLELEPAHALASSYRLEALMELNRWEDARQLAIALLGADRRLLAADGGQLTAAVLAVQEERLRAQPPLAANEVVLATFAARRGERQRAMTHLEKAVAQRSPYVPFLPVDPHFKPLYQDPGFLALMRRVGHPLADPATRT